MNIVIIVGPAAVGKMTVGQALAARTELKLFHNHMSLELVNQFFDFGTPAFRRLDRLIRFGIFEEVAKSNLAGLVFTFIWDFNSPEDQDYLEEIAHIFEQEGGNVYFVELRSELNVRLQRNRTPNRLEHKASKRDVDFSEKLLLNHEEEFRMNSYPDELPEKSILRIDNTHKSPEEVAMQIMKHYSL